MAAVHPAKRGLLQRPLRLADACAAASLLAAVVVAALRVAEPFDHGIWLVAYLVLVGFAAQLLLARGQLRLSSAPAAGQAVLWNFGVVAVPFGVLADSRLAVVAGGATLLVALARYWRDLAGSEPSPGAGLAFRAAYVCLLAVMTTSVFIGIGLGWDRPWV